MSAVAVTATERALAAHLLAHWWSRPLEEETAAWADGWAAARLASASLRRDTADVDSLERAAADDAPRLVEEFERLFVGPGRVPCPPYEALWRDEGQRREQGRLMSTATAAVARLYRTLDLVVSHDSHELPDHIVVELEALTYALDTEGSDEPTTHELLTQHLLIWIPKLCAAVEREAQVEFYRRLARLTPHWLAALAEPSRP
jgi:TorA maturation chaperone TorD